MPVGFRKKAQPRRSNLGIYTPPSAGDDRVKAPALLDMGLREKPFQDMTPASMDASGQMEMKKRTNRQKFGSFR